MDKILFCSTLVNIDMRNEIWLFSKHLTWLLFGIKSTVNVICNCPQLLERWIDKSLYSGEGKGLIHLVDSVIYCLNN